MYWENAFRDYSSPAGIGPKLSEDIVDYVIREKLFLPGDSVLDVGCGPGTFTLLFAGLASKVCGLDMSAGMLGRLLGEAKQRGYANVYAIQSKWADYAPCELYDLAFSSFCPGVNDPEAVLRLEERSSRSCCYAVNQYVDYFSMFMDVDGHKRKAICDSNTSILNSNICS